MWEESVNLSATGCWRTADKDALDRVHCFDRSLAEQLVSLFQGKTVVDLGCGRGDYTTHLLDKGISCRGYDGNPYTAVITAGLCEVADLAFPIELQSIFDWVLSLEVGEHIPSCYEDVFIDNLHRHNRDGIVLSWAIVGQGGTGHVNCRSNDYIIEKLKKLGYSVDVRWQERLRKSTSLSWFQNSLMVLPRT